ncbi:MAG TPA: hypothetical protein VF590_07620 [Isosphaeraceae bacterium]
MPRSRRYRPTVEPLGALRLPSSSALRLLGPLGALVEDAITPDPMSLSGRLHGAARGGPVIPDAGSMLDLAGAGRVGTLGPVRFTGAMHGVGVIRHGRAEGTLTLVNDRGASVTLRLLGPAQRGGSSLPDRFRFVVQEQAGLTRSLKGDQGTLRVTPRPAPGDVALVLRSSVTLD